MPIYHLTPKSVDALCIIFGFYPGTLEAPSVLEPDQLIDLCDATGRRAGLGQVVGKHRPNEDEPTVLDLVVLRLTQTKVIIHPNPPPEEAKTAPPPGEIGSRYPAPPAADTREVPMANPSYPMPHEAR